MIDLRLFATPIRIKIKLLLMLVISLLEQILSSIKVKLCLHDPFCDRTRKEKIFENIH